MKKTIPTIVKIKKILEENMDIICVKIKEKGYRTTWKINPSGDTTILIRDKNNKYIGYTAITTIQADYS